MNKVITPFVPKGTINVPGSKSYSHRYLIGSFLSDKLITLNNIYYSNDVLATLSCLNMMGGRFEINESQTISIKKIIKESDSIILNAEESASTLRMLLPISSFLYKNVTFIGNKSLFLRPLDAFKSIFDKEKIHYEHKENSIEKNGLLSMKIFDCSSKTSSQFMSGMLFLAAFCNSKYKITYSEPIVSRKYLDMTLKVLKDFGYSFKELDNSFSLETKEEPKTSEFTIEGDYSSAANFIVLGALKGEITLSNLNAESIQPDSIIIKLLKSIGANITYINNCIKISSVNNLKSFRFNIDESIDLGPILIVLASQIKGQSIIEGVNRLKIKESDRLSSILIELNKAGLEYEVKNDSIYIQGKESYKDGIIFESHNDHRITMALTIFSILTNGTNTINNVECVNKSYPTFFLDLEKLRK